MSAITRTDEFGLQFDCKFSKPELELIFALVSRIKLDGKSMYSLVAEDLVDKIYGSKSIDIDRVLTDITARATIETEEGEQIAQICLDNAALEVYSKTQRCQNKP